MQVMQPPDQLTTEQTHARLKINVQDKQPPCQQRLPEQTQAWVEDQRARQAASRSAETTEQKQAQVEDQ